MITNDDEETQSLREFFLEKECYVGFVDGSVYHGKVIRIHYSGSILLSDVTNDTYHIDGVQDDNRYPGGKKLEFVFLEKYNYIALAASEPEESKTEPPGPDDSIFDEFGWVKKRTTNPSKTEPPGPDDSRFDEFGWVKKRSDIIGLGLVVPDELLDEPWDDKTIYGEVVPGIRLGAGAEPVAHSHRLEPTPADFAKCFGDEICLKCSKPLGRLAPPCLNCHPILLDDDLDDKTIVGLGPQGLKPPSK